MMDRIAEIEARVKAAPRPDTYVPEFDKSRWGQDVVRITRCRDKPLTTLEFMPHTFGDVPLAEMLAHAGEDLWALLDRVRALEVGLRAYGRHKNPCGDFVNDVWSCTCGLAALVDGNPS